MWKTETLLKAIGGAARGECITEARMVEITGHDARSVENSCLKLRRHGLLVKTEQGCHKLTAAGRAALEQGTADLRSGPKGKHIAARIKKGTLRERAWRAMRLKRRFSIADLVMLCAQGGERDIEGNLAKYLRALEGAGFLRQLRVREQGYARTSNGFVRWLLIDDMDHGPLTPVYRLSHGVVYDPNIERSLPIGPRGPRPAALKREARS